MKRFLKNLWETQPNTVMGIGGAIILIGFFYSLTLEDAPKVRNQIVPKEKLEEKMTLQEEIKYMKACGRQLRVDRVNWYLDEKGITDNFERIAVIENTDLYDSDKPYELMESYKRLGITPKTGRNLPYVNCVPDARDKLPKDFLQKIGY